MRSIEIQERIEKANLFFPYIGTYSSAGNDGKNRISFIKSIKEIFTLRRDMLGIENKFMICSKKETDKGKPLALWDYFSDEIKDQGEYYFVAITKREDRLVFPKEVLIPKGRLTWYGKGDHIEIFEARDLERISC